MSTIDGEIRFWAPYKFHILIQPFMNHLSSVRQSITYLTRPFAPSAIESTVLPSIRMYANDPSNPTPKLMPKDNGK